MEAKLFLSLLILCLISTAIAKGGHHDHDRHGHRENDDDKKCLQPHTTPKGKLPMNCTVTDDCKAISCSVEFDGETVMLSLKFDTQPEISLKVPSRGYEWSHTLKSREKIQVTGFPLPIEGLADADIDLMLTKFEGEWGIGYKLELFVRTDISADAVHITLLEGKLPHSDEDYEPYEHKRWSKCQRFSAWFKRQSTSVKVSIVLGAVLVFLLLASAIFYCCKRRRVAKLKVKPPSYHEATSTTTKVPMEPLVNEE